MPYIAPFRQVVGHVSSWIQPDATDPAVRQSSVAALRHELGWAAHLGLQAVLLPAPHRPAACPNYAQVLHQVRAGGWKGGGTGLDCGCVEWKQNAKKHDVTYQSARTPTRTFGIPVYIAEYPCTYIRCTRLFDILKHSSLLEVPVLVSAPTP